ncbi:PilZ domain-containing protein [Brevibacillus ruminantium]|uniref:PilZ domain-containing protein n=1 Tax=Brevibacillus ruminantium TaxID=2950604 RepID=A0ABY4WHK3_9BACL|nr:PilZ domain-containing protein [Brevibacillus ruminantium]USG64121.1 PilZ domain-containing protein [Brevibacillus ruminantium]
MAEVISLAPFLADKRLHRGAVLHMMLAAKVKQSLQVSVEHAQHGYMIVSYVQEKDARQSLLGSTARFRWETDSMVTSLDLQVIQEETIWPVVMIRLLPVGIEISTKGELKLLQPDINIQIPYKVMGARPIEEKGEGTMLSFSPTRLILSTEGFVSVGEFLQLSFHVPAASNEIVAMAKVVEKNFEGGKSIIKLIYTDIAEKHLQAIREYYRKVAQSVS